MTKLKNLIKIVLLLLLITQGFYCSDQMQHSSVIAAPIITTKTTTLLPTIERVFSRKKRFLIFPKNTSLKFTISLGKHLLSMFPRSLTTTFEVAVYYPVPRERIELIPKRLRPKTTTTPKPRGTTEPLLVYIPGSLIRYKAQPAIKPMKVQRIDNMANTVQWIDSTHKYKNYNNPAKWSQWAKYGAPNYEQQHAWTPAKQTLYEQPWQPSNAAKWTKWTTPMPTSRKWWSNQDNAQWSTRHERLQRSYVQSNAESSDFDLDTIEPLYFADLEPVMDWQHYHSHRDRRQLFHQLEGLSKILGIDIKACILRAICDSKRFLLPPGYSMIQDILRVIFNFPTISGLTDEYSRAMQSDYATCDTYLQSSQCPLNLLHWLMNPEKSI